MPDARHSASRRPAPRPARGHGTLTLARPRRSRAASGLGVVVLVALFFAPLRAVARTEPVSVPLSGITFSVDAPDGMERFARRAAEVVGEGWPSVAAATGASTGDTVSISVEHDIAHWFERRGVPPRNPEWAAGIAMYGERAIVIRTANPEWEATLRHELVHIAIDLAAGGNRVPRWFHEGYAVATAEQWGLERSATMIRAGLSGNFYPFAELTAGFPAASSSADLAYAQSFHFVRFARRAHGEDVFIRVLARVSAGDAFDGAFEIETGTTLAVVEAEWAAYVTTRYKWAPALTGGGGAWGVIAALTVFAWRRSKIRGQRRLARLKQTESEVYTADPDDQTFG